MRFLRRSLVGIFLLAVTLSLLAFAGNTVRGAIETRVNAEPRSFPQRERVFSAKVVVVEPQTITPVMTVFGELRSERTLDLRAAVGGIVEEASVDLVDGGEVKAGTVLLRIDPANAQSTRDRAAADVQDAKANLRDAQRAIVLTQDELAAAVDQATLRTQALDRANDLLARGVGTAANVESAELSASSAAAAVLARRQAVADAEARVDQAVNQVSRMEINLADAARLLLDTDVTAMFDGTLSDVTIAPGSRISANEKFATLLDPTNLEVSFRISTSQYARLLDDQGNLIDAPVTVSIDENLKATGKITRESGAVGEGQTGRLLFAKLDSAAGFRPGDFVTVAVQEPALNRVALVPSSAVAADQTVLMVGEENRLQRVETQLLRRQGDDVIIQVRGLAGQQIIAERSPLLGEGIGINPILPGAVAEAPPPDELVALDADRRAKLLAFVDGSRMPAAVKTRLASQLEQDEVPASVIERLESRMGG